MSDLADLLYTRADETARTDLARLVALEAEINDLPVDDPRVREVVENGTYAAFIELRRALKHVGIAFLDGLPLVGPWFLRQFAAWKVET